MAPQQTMDEPSNENEYQQYNEPTFVLLQEEHRRVSFNDHNTYDSSSSIYQRLIQATQGEAWSVVSPMRTAYAFPSEQQQSIRAEREAENSPKPIRRRRSRSFNDYIEERDFGYGSIETLDVKKTYTPKGTTATSSNNNSKDIYSKDDDDDMPYSISVLYGAINCTIVLPVLMSFGNIIYRDNAFSDYMPVLIKLTLVSGLVHQLCFSIFSTLKFAVGSVQDAGLIFLSKMASDMVIYCREHGHDDDTTILATVTIGLGCASALLGVGLIVIGKLGLASYVQMLPTCVVAGYLAFIGWFVGISGLGIMAGESSVTPAVLIDNLVFVLPGVVGGAFIYTMVRKLRHVAVLPLCITFLLVLFYAILLASGSTVKDATESGWIRKSDTVPAWNETWDFLKFDKVVWGALPEVWMTWLGMLFVVALSSSLDVAAIELEVKKPLDYNRELGVVGISNLISGLTGGYTGSYIFSQTIFSLRIGVRSRIPGFSIAAFIAVVILLPFPILSYVPNFFYGSLLSMICIDLMHEWLWEFRSKVTPAEYWIGLSTFGLIQWLGVEYGIVAGVIVYMLCRRLGINVGELKTMYKPEEDKLITEKVVIEDIEDETTRLVTSSGSDDSAVSMAISF